MGFQGFYTNKGAELDAKLKTGAALHITRIAAGSGHTEKSAVVLSDERQNLTAGTPARSGTTVTLPATLTDVLAEESYLLTEVGVYAQDPDEGEVLYLVYPLETAMPVTAGAGELTIRLELDMLLSATAELTVIGTAAGLLTEGDLTALRGQPNGLAALDESGSVPPGQMPYGYGTEDLVAGESPLETGRLYFVYA